ncbi:hypothetical protein PSCICN_41420 [Pseudomonas cichorii]|uniref:hypothetical protein n=1 Tax=Pseudomonas cichorii TaxID=36746 RepID=UPI001910F60B|nr:hypothetical protein [Pseudomonas cichorii]GFM83450.1 hypothetical protein PSCICN_41420 [Pseudomonas cichorii]
MAATLFAKAPNPGHEHEQVTYPVDDLPDLPLTRHVSREQGNLEAAQSASL